MTPTVEPGGRAASAGAAPSSRLHGVNELGTSLWLGIASAVGSITRELRIDDTWRPSKYEYCSLLTRAREPICNHFSLLLFLAGRIHPLFEVFR